MDDDDRKRLQAILASSFGITAWTGEQQSTVTDDVTAAFKEFVGSLRLPGRESVDPGLSRLFMDSDGLVLLVLEQTDPDRTLCNNLVKLHDIWSNSLHRSGGRVDDGRTSESIVGKVLHSLLSAHFASATPFSSAAIGSAVLNYGALYPDQVKVFAKSVARVKSEIPGVRLDGLVPRTDRCHEVLARAVANHCDPEEVSVVLSDLPISREVHAKLLLSRSGLGPDAHLRLVCHLSRSSTTEATFAELFGKALALWADPVVARAHVTLEVVHCTKLVLAMFRHLGPERALEMKTAVVEAMAAGLPNHFNSVDVRTVRLAKFVCEFVTESLKGYEDGKEKREVECPDDGLCLEVLRASGGCCEEASSSLPVPEVELPEHVDVVEDDKDSDDDDDDLDPVESNDIDWSPDSKTRIVYLRDFLDNVQDIKTYPEMELAMRSLPAVIGRQLRLEHDGVANEVLDSLFAWENDFDQPALDGLHRSSLCSVLESTAGVAPLEHFCGFFRGAQPHRKNLVLDVLSSVSRSVPLERLVEVSRCAFGIVLDDETAISRQDVSVKIPMVLFFGRLLGSAMPAELVEERMVVAYLNCLNRLDGEEAAVEQSVRYALANVLHVVERLQSVSSEGAPGLRSAVADSRNWLCKVGI